MMDQYEGFSGIYIIINRIKLYAFVGLICGSGILKHGLGNVTFVKQRD